MWLNALQDEIRSVSELLRPRAEKKNIRLEIIDDKINSRTIRTDGLRLRQILINIIGNAIKFTEKGLVKVSVSEINSLIRIEVTDTGIGVLPEHQKEIFSPFSQADADIAARFGGSGLGLAISARLAVALGGWVELTSSVPDEGSTFSVFIETNLAGNRSSQQLKKPELSMALKGLRILTVDDNRDVQDLLCELLGYAGALVDRADNGKVAVEKIAHGKFDVIFMDVQMPEMNGYEATAKLRNNGCTVPIVALTAFASTDTNARCLDAGFSDVLYKPFDKNDLIRMTMKHSGANGTLV